MLIDSYMVDLTNPYRSNMTKKMNRLLLVALFIATTVTIVSSSTSKSSVTSTANSAVCPGSAASVHAKCQMKVEFPQMECQKVLEEIDLRLKHENSWVDPHNNGKYELLSSSSATDDHGEHVVLVKASRRTGSGGYTDLLNIQLTEREDHTCVLETCSESQGTSDDSTNYCNLHNLYCGDAGCNAVKHEFTDYKEEYVSCKQNIVANCSA
jgi:hypothetical protein